MARDPLELRRLIEERAALSPDERACVIDQATKAERFRPLPRNFALPVLEGGTRWIGGDLRREDLSDDDGR